MRRLLDLEAAADARHKQGDPRIPATRLAHRTINAYSGALARNPVADTTTRKASGITVEEYKKIVTAKRRTRPAGPASPRPTACTPGATGGIRRTCASR